MNETLSALASVSLWDCYGIDYSVPVTNCLYTCMHTLAIGHLLCISESSLLHEASSLEDSISWLWGQVSSITRKECFARLREQSYRMQRW